MEEILEVAEGQKLTVTLSALIGGAWDSYCVRVARSEEEDPISEAVYATLERALKEYKRTCREVVGGKDGR